MSEKPSLCLLRHIDPGTRLPSTVLLSHHLCLPLLSPANEELEDVDPMLL